jgi:hypothetical protein
VLAALALILPGCGGGGGGNEAQVVRGDGFRFEAPSGWEVRGTVATDGAVDRVGVSTFRLVKPYRPSLVRAATVELDRVADRLAAELGGRVASRTTVTAARARARSYRIDYDGKTTEVTFVLSGRTEYQLLCRRRSDAGDEACRQLVSTFRLT